MKQAIKRLEVALLIVSTSNRNLKSRCTMFAPVALLIVSTSNRNGSHLNINHLKVALLIVSTSNRNTGKDYVPESLLLY